MTEVSAQDVKTSQIRYSWQRWVESWYLSYALLGATALAAVGVTLGLVLIIVRQPAHQKD